jgi:hypothetical protein
MFELAARRMAEWDHDDLWAKVIALGARNGVEDLHANGAFSDAQAPALNRRMRSAVYELLVAMRALGTTADDAPLVEFLATRMEEWDDDPLVATLPGALGEAVHDFAAEADIAPSVADKLEAAAVAGAHEAAELYANAGDPEKLQGVGFLVPSIPEYWEPPDVGPEQKALLDRAAD